MLVALLLLLVFTLRTTVVSIFSSISCPLVVVISMVFINNPGVMSNNTRMVITRLLFFMAIGLLMNTMLMNTMLMVTTRGQLMLENMDTTVVLSVKTRRSRSATSIPMRTLARSPRQLARRLLTPFTLRSVRKLSTLSVRKLTSSTITVSMLLDMNQMLLLDLLAFMKNIMERAMVMVMDMEGIRVLFPLFRFVRNK